MALKWAIIGAGRISHDFITAIRTLPEGNHQVMAVAGRDKVKVQEYATEHQIPKAYDNYDKIAQDKDVGFGRGAILDLGIYILQFQQFVFRGLKPIDIVVNGHKNSAGTDEAAGAIITYPGGKTAVVLITARLALPNEGLIVGTNGTLRLPLFWCPTKLITDTATYEWPLPDSKVPFLHKNSAGFSYEADEARKCIKKGLLESPFITLDESIEIARLMDLMRTKLGGIFLEDSQEFCHTYQIFPNRDGVDR